jgi:hypothetical protein
LLVRGVSFAPFERELALPLPCAELVRLGALDRFVAFDALGTAARRGLATADFEAGSVAGGS